MRHTHIVWRKWQTLDCLCYGIGLRIGLRILALCCITHVSLIPEFCRTVVSLFKEKLKAHTVNEILHSPVTLASFTSGIKVIIGGRCWVCVRKIWFKVWTAVWASAGYFRSDRCNDKLFETWCVFNLLVGVKHVSKQAGQTYKCTKGVSHCEI